MNNDKVEITNCANRDEAQALSNFLWNEKMRHIDDIQIIEKDLDDLKLKWAVWPDLKRRFVKP